MRIGTIEVSEYVGEKEIEVCKSTLPWRIALTPVLFYDEDDNHRGGTFLWKLFEFPEGISRRRAEYRVRSAHWIPAEPIHMLMFATQCFDVIQNLDTGKYHNYIIGLGGDFQTVLGLQCRGLMGMNYFFTLVSQRKWIHAGGRSNLFLGVRRHPVGCSD